MLGGKHSEMANEDTAKGIELFARTELEVAVSKITIWMPFYIADYLADTTRLTTEQHGAYLLLIMDYWRNGPLPDDDLALANITRLNSQAWKKNRSAMVRMFQLSEGSWCHKRIDEERSRALSNQSSKSRGGKAGSSA
ncbi:protein containing DUF1376, partial [mine drainage metagenome]